MKTEMSIGKKIFALAACVAAIVACGPDYERTEITAIKPSPLGGSASDRHVTVPEGMIVKAHIVPENDDGEPMQAHVVSRDESVIEVVAIVNDRDYAFIGHKPGTAEIEFQADGETVFVIVAEVTPQPPPEELDQ